MNIYQMYVEHWKRPGFWIRRITWGNTIAKIEYVGDLKGRGPYYGNPEVRGIVYDLHTGEQKDVIAITTAGTYKSWLWVDPPSWSSDEPFDPRKDRVLLHIPVGDNKKASSMGARWSEMLEAWWIPHGDKKLLSKAEKKGYLTPEERIYFEVPFEDKDTAKNLGARWFSQGKLWSLNVKEADAIAMFESLGYKQIEIK